MMAKRISTILPDLTFKEALDITKIYSIAGALDNEGIIVKRPFRSPHHTITEASMIGGGKIPKPGEISLAHHGVLFLDELPEYTRNILELLREPLEDKKVTIARMRSTITYPCNFMLIASMNPCPCGYYGVIGKKCTCSELSRDKYLNKIRGPLLDRIDLHIEVTPIKYDKLSNRDREETSKEIKERVDMARKIQQERYRYLNIFSNSELTPLLIEKYCKIDNKSKIILKEAFDKFGLTARAYSKILKIARTIADLEGKENIQMNHLAEAIGYRSLDKKYGNKF